MLLPPACDQLPDIEMTEMLRKVTTTEIPQLLSMMLDYYEEGGIPFDENKARVAFEGLIEDSRNGQVWLIIDNDTVAGYASLTLGYSLEFGGRDAFIDNIYVRPQDRNRGLGYKAISVLVRSAAAAGARAVHLEVDRENRRAQHIYEKAGFEPRQRYFLMSKYLRSGKWKAESGKSR